MAYVTPVTNWAGGAIASADLNRIEGNIVYLKAHADDTTIHQTTAQTRENTGALVIEARTSDPTTPVNGRIWLRTDL